MVRGRRIDEERSEHILEAVLELLKDVGYDQLRMQDVADRAGVGLATIYRRWPTKQDLMCASLERVTARENFATTDDPRADVRDMLTQMARDVGDEGANTLLGFFASFRTDPDIAQAFRDTVVASIHEFLVDRLTAELGDDCADIDVRAAAGPAIVFYLGAVCGRPIDAESVGAQVTEMLFAPTPVALPY